ncbi:type I-E CRISPR-associated protein Cas6/Cse3/CasE [Nocardia sp. NBC_01503]|uniref:type I-E CRISPR-associated protein Cas6/Cse3/CasE n=1 Tax=Nocardia sp. NBC_01503 TaxID=2975997 RepID=UPI002E7B875C|nr:type I-E CRISPR-associated protein Cas6/Cse3/CasE [Nocardia sp. NBC_01503]WTL32739.1 type I-E CRISPR-associated protein Cas6/Cse3/CasE [Nocardia sp. NBC_01503]
MRATLITCHSILELNARHPETQRALLDAQAMHRLVMKGFLGWVDDGSRDARAQMGVLHTSNVDLKNQQLTIVVQSKVPPDWSQVDKRQLLREPQILKVDQNIDAGQQFRFRTVINPARMSSRHLPSDERTTPRQDRKRLADTTPAHARQWFAERLQPQGDSAIGPRGVRRIGADSDAAQLAVRMLPKLAHLQGKPGMRIGRAEVRGELTVTEPEVFVDVVSNGLGHGKAYGCGLILIKPITTRAPAR